MSRDGREPPQPPPASVEGLGDVIRCLERQATELTTLGVEGCHDLISFIGRQIERLRMITDEDRLSEWIDHVRVDPSNRQPGLSY